MTTRRAGNRRILGGMLVGVGLTLALLPIGAAHSATVSNPGFTAKATASVTPSRLPQTKSVPVRLSLVGGSEGSESISRATLQAVDVRTDRQLTVDIEGLPSCDVTDIMHASLSQARQRCGGALIGTGTAHSILRFPEQPVQQIRYSLLVFHTLVKGRPQLLLHTTSPDLPYSRNAGPIGSVGSFRFPVNEYQADTSNSFQLRLGKTWRYRGKRHSYLSGQCRTGSLRNRIRLILSAGSRSDVSSQRCRKAS